MELRPHQELAVNMLRDSLKRGNKRPILAAPCSFGKTITALHMLQCAAEKGKRGIFICDRIKLVQQSLESADFHGLDVGVIQANHERTNWNAPIQIASIHTMARKSKMIEFDFASAFRRSCCISGDRSVITLMAPPHRNCGQADGPASPDRHRLRAECALRAHRHGR